MAWKGRGSGLAESENPEADLVKQTLLCSANSFDEKQRKSHFGHLAIGGGFDESDVSDPEADLLFFVGGPPDSSGSNGSTDEAPGLSCNRKKVHDTVAS